MSESIMTPSEAANHYFALEQSDLGAARSFAREYEDSATEADFDSYLHFLDLHYVQAEAA